MLVAEQPSPGLEHRFFVPERRCESPPLVLVTSDPRPKRALSCRSQRNAQVPRMDNVLGQC
jgi:hypothetical protein